MTPEQQDRRFAVLVGEAEQEQPFALPLGEFIAAKTEAPPALIGDPDEILVPHAGLAILYAKGGKGKTTLTIDLAFHAAAGIDWLGFPVDRPLRVLVIENEGPREPFRRKLEAKRQAWPHEIAGELFVYTENWGSLRLDGGTPKLRDFIEAERVELVVGDPLDSLGISGVGSPEDTRLFVELLKHCGLFRDVAFWLLHHGRKQEADDELDEISGAWGGRPDTMLRLDKLGGNRGRLSFPKLRWSQRAPRAALLLAFDPDTETFTAVGEERDEERDLPAEIEELLADGKPRTAPEISAPKKDGGTGTNLDSVKATLRANRDRFRLYTGNEAKVLGRRSDAQLWGLTRLSESPESPRELLGGAREGDSLTRLLKESASPECATGDDDVLSQRVESADNEPEARA